MIVPRIKRAVHADTLPLVGCPRRNQFEQGSFVNSWGVQKGNAVLATVGERVKIGWPGGYFDVYLDNEHSEVLLFRGGKFKPWWVEDAQVIVGAILANSSVPLRGARLIWEVDNELHERYVECPSDAALAAYEAALEGWGGDTPARISKRSERAGRLCPRCPVRVQCDLIDMRTGHTDDWPKQ